MRTRKMVHGSYARTVLTEEEAARLRRAGWLEVTDSKPVNANTARQRRFRERQQERGMKEIVLWIPADVYQDMLKLRQPGECLTGLLVRLVKKFTVIQ